MVVSDNDNNQRAAVIGLAKTSAGARVEAQLEANGSTTQGPSVIVGAVSSHPLYIRTGNLTRMTVATNGNVGINTSLPNYKLEVNGSAAKTGGGSWTVASDRRLKENIHSFNAGLDQLIKIEPVVFDYTHQSGLSNGKEQVGVVAQEIQKIAPYMIEEFDKDGEEYLAVNNSAMVYMLINSVKELNQKIEDLEAEIEKLKLDKVLFVPSNISPHKNAKNIISSKARYRMVQIAIKDYHKFEVLDYEIINNRTSYTIYTIQYLKKKFEKNAKIYFLFFI